MEYVDKGSSVSSKGNWTLSLHGMINIISKNTGEKFDGKNDTLDWFYTNVNKLKDERLKHLFQLLVPIQWPWSSSIESRKNLVTKRHNEVSIIYPFLNATEKKLADQWIKENNCSGLWY